MVIWVKQSAAPPGVQGEAVRQEARVVPDWLVRRQLVQDPRPVHQLHRGADDGGGGGPRHHGDRHAQP